MLVFVSPCESRVIIMGLGRWDEGESRTIEVYTTDARVCYVLLFLVDGVDDQI